MLPGGGRLGSPRFRDVGADALDEVFARPGRTLVSAVLTAVGVGGFIATMALGESAQIAIRDEFLRLAVVQASVLVADDHEPLSTEAVERLGALRGVRSVGTLATVRTSGDVKAAWDGQAPLAGIQVLAASPQLAEAAELEMSDGRWLTAGDYARDGDVAVLGSGAAASIGLLGVGKTVLVDGSPLLVVGVFDDSPHRPDLLSSLIVSVPTAQSLWEPFEGAPQLIVNLSPGFAQEFASRAPAVLRPEAPDDILTLVGPEPTALAEGVQGNIGSLNLALWVLLAAMGAVTIGNSTLSSVFARANEIGLRRALGARPVHIAFQILSEAAVAGFVGAAVGVVIGTVGAGVWAVAREWIPVVDFQRSSIALGFGVTIGLVAGIYPALRAATLRPADALRR